MNGTVIRECGYAEHTKTWVAVILTESGNIVMHMEYAPNTTGPDMFAPDWMVEGNEVVIDEDGQVESSYNIEWGFHA